MIYNEGKMTMKSINLKIQDSSHYEIIDLIKGICAIFMIMLHAIPGETPLHKLLLMPFHAQLTIPFFMIISGFNWTGSVEKTQKWYSCSNLFRKVKRVVLPYLPALIIEIIFLGWPGNIFTWLA